MMTFCVMWGQIASPDPCHCHWQSHYLSWSVEGLPEVAFHPVEVV